VRFRPGTRLDPSQVEDRRGSGGFSVPGGGLAVGGGGLGVTGLVIYLLITLLTNGSGLSAPLQSLDNRSVGAQPAAGCSTAQQANTREDCRIVGYVNSIQAYWNGQFRAAGRTYTISRTVFFDGSTPTGCGTASTDVGPFYCPVDKEVYVDLGFFEELRTRFALNAAAAVGDDRIQQETQGRIDQDTWTHGSSAERERWFTAGYRSGRPAACDTSGKL
jgi:predicted metalloprotease